MVPVGADVVAEAGGEEDEEPQEVRRTASSTKASLKPEVMVMLIQDM